MKILQILPKFDKGGVESATMLLSEKLLSDGHESHVAAKYGDYVPKHISFGGKYYDLNLASKNPITILINAFRLSHYIKTNEIDIVHARSRAPAYSAFIAAQFCSKPFVTTFHAAYGHKGWLKKLYNSIMLRAQKIIAISKFIEAHIKMHYAAYLDGKEIDLIPEGVDLGVFNPNRSDLMTPEALKVQLGIDLKSKILLMPGRLTPIKGQVIVMKAFSELAKVDPKLHLILLGSDQGRHRYRAELGNLIDDLRLNDRVHLVDHSHDLAHYLNGADVVIQATLKPEAFGRVIAEAMAMEKITVASNIGAPREIITDQETGFLHEVNSAENLSEVLRKILTLGDAEIRMIGSAAREHIEKKYALDAVLEKQISLYKSLLKK